MIVFIYKRTDAKDSPMSFPKLLPGWGRERKPKSTTSPQLQHQNKIYCFKKSELGTHRLSERCPTAPQKWKNLITGVWECGGGQENTINLLVGTNLYTTNYFIDHKTIHLGKPSLVNLPPANHSPLAHTT